MEGSNFRKTNWANKEEYYRGGRKDIIFTINPEAGIVTRTTLWTKDSVKIYNKRTSESGSARPLKKEIEQRKFVITNVAADLITAELKKKIGIGLEKISLYINILEGTIKYELSLISKKNGNILSSYSLDMICNDLPSENSASGSSGTAFFINSKGYLLTNHHVIDGCKEQKINYGEKEIDVKIIASDKSLDLALLKADIRPKSYISVTNDKPKKRQRVTAAGYPLGKFLSDDLKINDGRISALKGFEDNSFQIQHDIPINPGNSGGPIVNEDGELVAIAVSGMSKEVTEGLNFGIKVSAVKNFLNSNKIKASSSFMSLGMNDDKLIDHLEKSTVYTFCK